MRWLLRIVPWMSMVGCATAPPPGPAAPARQGKPPATPAIERVELEPFRIEIRRRGDGTEMIVSDAASLFEEAGVLLSAREFDAALARYDRLLAEFPESRYVAAALYNAGLAHEGKNEWAAAALRYKALADRDPDGKDGTDALFRLGGVFAETKNWPASAEVFGRVLAKPDLALADFVEAAARRGLAQYQLEDYQGAERTLREALRRHERDQLAERIDSRFFIAMVHYYLAAIPHARFRVMAVRLPEKLMEQDLEEKARLLLIAQAGYIDAIKDRDPHWATAAGYQVGALYREFHDALITAPIPPELNEEAREIYVSELRKAVRPLLQKAMGVYEKTLLMAERVGVRNDWVERSLEQLDEMRALLRAAPPLGSSPQGP